MIIVVPQTRYGRPSIDNPSTILRRCSLPARVHRWLVEGWELRFPFTPGLLKLEELLSFLHQLFDTSANAITLTVKSNLLKPLTLEEYQVMWIEPLDQ